MLKRKIDQYLAKWKADRDKLPLIIKGARQVGKTSSVMAFAKANYKNVVAVNFVLEKKYSHIFDDGYDVESVVRNLSLINPELQFEPQETLIFFDEMQDCPACATSLTQQAD